MPACVRERLLHHPEQHDLLGCGQADEVAVDRKLCLHRARAVERVELGAKRILERPLDCSGGSDCVGYVAEPLVERGQPRFEIVRTLRREGRDLPIVVLTARSDEIDRVVGLEIGADDYVTKPFSPRELVARVKAIGRRAGLTPSPGPAMLTFGRLQIDEAAREARVDGIDVGLKPREFALLLELATNPGVALSRAMLLQKVWGYDFDGDERTIDVHIRRLRMKLEERARLPSMVRTIHGFGYKFTR